MTQYLNLTECTQKQVHDFIKRMSAQHFKNEGEGKYVTNIQIREGLGSNNLQSVSVSFVGADPEKVKSILINELNGKDNQDRAGRSK